MTMAVDMDYFAAALERNMRSMYDEAKHLCGVSGDDFPEGMGVIILTHDPADYDKYDPEAYEVIEQTMHLSDEEPHSSDEDSQEIEVLEYREMMSETSQQQADNDEMIARALRQLTQAKDKAAEVVVDETTVSNSASEQLASELVGHLQHSTFGVQIAIDELNDTTHKLSKNREMPYEDIQREQ